MITPANTDLAVAALFQEDYDPTERYMLVHPRLFLRLLELAEEGHSPEEILLGYYDTVRNTIVFE